MSTLTLYHLLQAVLFAPHSTIYIYIYILHAALPACIADAAASIALAYERFDATSTHAQGCQPFDPGADRPASNEPLLAQNLTLFNYIERR